LILVEKKLLEPSLIVGLLKILGTIVENGELRVKLKSLIFKVK